MATKATIDPSMVVFKDITSFDKKLSALGNEELQVSSSQKVSLHDIAALAQTSGLIISATDKEFSYIANNSLHDIYVVGLYPTNNHLYLSDISNGFMLDGSTEKRWGLAFDLSILDDAGNEIELKKNYITCYITKNPGDEGYDTLVPTGLVTFTGDSYQATINFDGITALIGIGKNVTSDSYAKSGISRSQLFTVADLFGDALMPVSQRLLTRATNEYNVSTFHSIQGRKVFTLPEAIQLIPQNIRKLNLKAVFLTQLEFKPGASLQAIAIPVTYQYGGPSISPGAWNNVYNWVSVTPIVLTDAQYTHLVDPVPNTTYYVEEDQIS